MPVIKFTVKNKTPELLQKVEKAVSRFIRKGAEYIEGELKSSMAEPKSGRKYKRGSRIHIASASGESPAVDYGDYDNSLQTILENSLEAKIGTPLEYPLYLEEGTEKIEPRPLWEKTVADIFPTLEKMLDNELKSI